MTRSWPRRGVAMLLTLIAVVVVSTTGVAMLRHSAAFSMESKRGLFESRTRLTVQDLREPLIAWVRERSRSDVDTPPFGGTLQIGSWSINIYPVDLAGCLHSRWLGIEAIAGALPEELQHARLPQQYEALDWERCSPGQRPTVEELVAHTDGSQPPVKALEWLTVSGKGELNIATAPIPLLDTALGLVEADARDVRAILEARATNASIDTGAASRVIAAAKCQADRAPGSVVPLTQSSGSWGFAIEVSEGLQHARYWMTIEQAHWTKDNHRRSDWTIVEFRRVP